MSRRRRHFYTLYCRLLLVKIKLSFSLNNNYVFLPHHIVSIHLKIALHFGFFLIPYHFILFWLYKFKKMPRSSSKPSKGEIIASTFYTEILNSMWSCNLCGGEYDSVGPSHTNLKMHSQNQHSAAYKNVVDAMQTGVTLKMSKYQCSKDTLHVYAWL